MELFFSGFIMVYENLLCSFFCFFWFGGVIFFVFIVIIVVCDWVFFKEFMFFEDCVCIWVCMIVLEGVFFDYMVNYFDDFMKFVCE